MNYEDLEIYNMAFNLADELYNVTLTFPEFERFGLSSQIQRASVSIFSNIAEGFKRGTSKDFRNFLFMSRGSLAEARAQLSFSYRRKYVRESELKSMNLKIDDLGRKLTRFIKNMNH